MNRNIIARIALLSAFWLVLASVQLGCKSAVDDNSQADKVETKKGEISSESAVRIITSKTLPDKPLRMVSMAPSVTEILFALGMGERLVGVTRYCDFPVETAHIPKIGGMLDPDFEAIVATRPDLVVGVLGGADSRIGDRLEAAGIPYFFVQMDTIAQAYEGIVHIGRVAGDEAAGRAMSEQLEKQLTEMSQRLVEKRAGADRKRVLMVFDHEPVVSAGVGTFSYELIELAGFQSATAGIDNPYPVLDIEKVIELNPDILIDSKVTDNQRDAVQFWAKYPMLRAVQSGAVRQFDPSVLRPGPRLVDALETIGAVDDQVVAEP